MLAFLGRCEWSPLNVDVIEAELGELLPSLAMVYQHQRKLQLDSMLSPLSSFNSSRGQPAGGTIKGGGGMAGGLGGAGGVHGDGGVEMQLAKENRARENARKGRLRRKALEYRAETGDLDALRELLSSKDAVDAFAKGDIGRKQGARSGARRGSYGSRVF